MFKKDIYDDIYYSHFKLIVATEKELEKYMQKNYSVEVETSYGGAYFVLDNKESGEQHRILWINDQGETELTFNILKILTHELIHACTRTFDGAGIQTTIDNDEPMAYYYTYLFGQVFPHLVKFYEKRSN